MSSVEVLNNSFHGMQISRTISLVMLLGLINLVSTAAPPFIINSSPGRDRLVNTTIGFQPPASFNRSGSAITFKDYPLDPYQMRVPGTTTSLIFSKYGPQIYFQTFLDLTAQAQYQLVKAVAAAHGDGHVQQPNFEWHYDGLYIRISRPLSQEELTWLMLADTLEGLRVFFGRWEGWFETSITILDDTAGPVGRGSVTLDR